MKNITIEPTTGADTRSAKGPVSKEVLLSNSHLHISHVRRVMAALSAELIERAERHDYTKITAIDDFHENFTQATRKEKAIEFKDHRWWKLHLTEKHHINDRLHDDADLLDLLEMIVDCVCAGKARTGDVFPVKIESDVLQQLLSNTVTLLTGSVHSEGHGQ
jgi:hypothetical protein